MEQRKWLYVVVVVLTIITLSLFIIVWQSWMPRGSGGGAAQSPPRLAQSPADAATVLQTWIADNWTADAAIVACTLTLSRRNPTEHSWTFQAYSAQKNQLLVAVVQGQDVQVLRDIDALYRPSVLPATAWNQDIQNILKVWWRAGGSTAWNATATSTITMHLSVREDGSPAWQLTLVKDKLNVFEYWEIHADTGVLLEHTSTGGQ